MNTQKQIPAKYLRPGDTLCFDDSKFNYVIEEIEHNSMGHEVQILSGNNTLMESRFMDELVLAIAKDSGTHYVTARSLSVGQMIASPPNNLYFSISEIKRTDRGLIQVFYSGRQISDIFSPAELIEVKT